MNILVTGCGGFIGSSVWRLLLESGHCVTGLDGVHPGASPLARWRLRDIARECRQIELPDAGQHYFRHSGGSRNPEWPNAAECFTYGNQWIPDSAGMTGAI